MEDSAKTPPVCHVDSHFCSHPYPHHPHHPHPASPVFFGIAVAKAPLVRRVPRRAERQLLHRLNGLRGEGRVQRGALQTERGFVHGATVAGCGVPEETAFLGGMEGGKMFENSRTG